MENFKIVGEVDVLEAKQALASWDDLFDVVTFRQEWYEQQKDTKTIYLRSFPVLTQEASANSFDLMVTEPACIPEFAKLLEDCAALVNRPMGRAMLIKLAPGGVIGEHTDNGRYADATDRYHLPILTNPGAWLYAGDERMHIPEGQLCLFEKHIPHGGANDGETPRVHLVVDFLK